MDEKTRCVQEGRYIDEWTESDATEKYEIQTH